MSAIFLKLACPDRVGLLARLTGFIAERGGNLLEVNQFTDPLTRWFFVRMAIDSATLTADLAALRREFVSVGEELEAEWTIRDEHQQTRAVVLVSRLGHCLADLLWRWRARELPMEIALVISNHEDFREMVEREGIAFRHVPIPAENKGAAFDRLHHELASANAELVILARYMQILPAGICRDFPGRIVNIHHSFLPSFVGGNPYRRAYERGVKLIGATCHYVTSELDEGPIIEQEVLRVEHHHSPDDLLRLGRDCERLALARGLRYHLHDRVLIHGRKTIVFRD